MVIARISAAVASTVLVVGYIVGSGRWVTTGDGWYRSLERPPWQPPSAVIGIIWPYNFAALIAAGIAVAFSGSPAARTVWLVGLALSVAMALAWARLFFASHSLWPAAIALIASAVLTVPIGLVLASAFSAIIVYAQELVPSRVGMIAGLFFGFAFGMAGLGAAVLGWLADQLGIQAVYQICSFLPLVGLLTGFLPNLETHKAKHG